MDQQSGRQPPEWPDDRGRELTPREQETAGQLRLMDPHLAGLYEHGIRLLRRRPGAGDVRLLAHCGRELSRGVLQLLLDDEGPGAFPQELKQEHRPRTAHALDLPEDDPRVDGWYTLHQLFCKWVHWKYPGPSRGILLTWVDALCAYPRTLLSDEILRACPAHSSASPAYAGRVHRPVVFATHPDSHREAEKPRRERLEDHRQRFHRAPRSFACVFACASSYSLLMGGDNEKDDPLGISGGSPVR